MSAFEADSACVKRIVPAVNFGERPAGSAVDMLLLHYTGMETADAALNWLCVAESQVSCHYFIFEDGEVLQLVGEEKRAWHAGRGIWEGNEDTNSRSIGIEIVNGGHDYGLPPFPDVQIKAVIELSKDIISRHLIEPHRVLAHSDIAPGRKRDPGELFPWARLAEHGIGLWREPAPIRSGTFFQLGDEGQPVEAVQTMLALYGYGVPESGVFDEATQRVVAAFQRHFRPEKVDGVADPSTIETLHRLCAAKLESMAE
ncbi:MAG: N-acetylmuramoyl-L-alanine amidase [Pseudomonadota bacterium]